MGYSIMVSEGRAAPPSRIHHKEFIMIKQPFTTLISMMILLLTSGCFCINPCCPHRPCPPTPCCDIKPTACPKPHLCAKPNSPDANNSQQTGCTQTSCQQTGCTQTGCTQTSCQPNGCRHCVPYRDCPHDPNYHDLD